MCEKTSILCSMMRKNKLLSTLLCALIMFVAYPSNAQELKDIKKYKKELSEDKLNELQQYISDIQTTLYLDKNEGKIFGEGQVKYLKSDVESFLKLNENNAKYSAIEFIELKLSKEGDENKINLSKINFNNFRNLKYVLIRSSYELNENQFQQIFANTKKNGVVFLYEIAIPQ